MGRQAERPLKSLNNSLFSQAFLSKALDQKIKLRKPALRISTDSRHIRKGDLFAAISGEKFDGHDFVHLASKAGAVGAIVSSKTFKNFDQIPKDFNLIRVKNTTEALRKLAQSHRRRLKIPVIAVAGSNGKTTTKEWIAFLLGQIFGPQNIFKTQKSNNSILGIALSLLQIGDEKIAVIEIGIDEPGWMDKHLKVVQPTHGIITTIAEEHLNHLKNIETVAREELKLLKFLTKEKGGFVANLDSPWIMKSKFPKNSLTYSLETRADIEGLFSPPEILNVFGLSFKNPLPGKHNAQNLLAALATIRLIKPDLALKDLKNLQASISSFEGEAHRSRLVTLKNNIRVLDDCYNANPDSMEKSIQAFSDLSKGCIQRLVLGDMLDLGKSTSDAHRRILNLALVSGFDRIYLFGEEFSKALKNSKNNSHAKTFLKMEDLIEGLKKDLAPDDFVFLKGSRGMRLERVLESLSQ